MVSRVLGVHGARKSNYGTSEISLLRIVMGTRRFKPSENGP